MESMLLQKIIKPEGDVTSINSAKALIDSINTLLQREGYGQKKEGLRNDIADIVRPWHGNDERKTSAVVLVRGVMAAAEVGKCKGEEEDLMGKDDARRHRCNEWVLII